MPWASSILLFCLVFLGWPGFADPVDSSVVKTTGKAFRALVSVLPNGETKRGLLEYAEILGADQYGSDLGVMAANRGISNYFVQKFRDPSNSCVRDSAFQFYRDVAIVLRKKNSSKSCSSLPPPQIGVVDEPDYGCSGRRPGLRSLAGKEPYDNLSPGWLWRLALKHANGDANSALFLIGMCGHDDVDQGEFEVLDQSPQAQFELDNLIRELKAKKDKTAAQALKILGGHSEKNKSKLNSLNLEKTDLDEKIKRFEKQKGLVRNLKCPLRESGFFAPQSLGESADIPSDLKVSILASQSADGAQQIPAKAYHVYSAAFMASQLIQNGFSADQASFLERQAARLYRGITMCEIVNSLSRERWELNRSLKDFGVKSRVQDPIGLVEQSVQKIRRHEIECASSDSDQKPKECKLVENFGFSIYSLADSSYRMNDKMIHQKISQVFAKMDAAELYERWYLGSPTVSGMKLLCTDKKVLGPRQLMDPMESFFGRLLKPSGWTDERFQAASRKLATWDVDFKWTIAQHEAGARFAAQNCKKRNATEKPLKGICPAIDPSSASEIRSSPAQGSRFAQ